MGEVGSGGRDRRASTGDWSERQHVNDRNSEVVKGEEGSPVPILPVEMCGSDRGEEAVIEGSDRGEKDVTEGMSRGGDDDDGINLVVSDSLREGGEPGEKVGGVDEGIEVEGGTLWEVCAYPVLLEGLQYNVAKTRTQHLKSCFSKARSQCCLRRAMWHSVALSTFLLRPLHCPWCIFCNLFF